jgi:hypothetical protein
MGSLLARDAERWQPAVLMLTACVPTGYLVPYHGKRGVPQLTHHHCEAAHYALKCHPTLKDEHSRHPNSRSGGRSLGCTLDITTARRSCLPTSLARLLSITLPRLVLPLGILWPIQSKAVAHEPLPRSTHGARIQTSRSWSVVKITGIAIGWIGSTIAFGAVVTLTGD